MGLSKGAAFYRKTAVELIQGFPEVIEPLRDGRLCLMSVAEVARVLTAENRDDVLPRFFHLSKREAQALAVALLPNEAPPQREMVTTIRVPTGPMLALTAPAGPVSELPDAVVQPVEPAERGPAVAPVEPAVAVAHAHPPEAPLQAAQRSRRATVLRRRVDGPVQGEAGRSAPRRDGSATVNGQREA
jgi:hypothetical protein